MVDKAVYTTKNDLLLFFHLLDTDPTIRKFLQYDTSFCLADKYLIAMVFIYFKRAQLSPEDYTYLNFFAGLCLAHSMEEDIGLTSEIYPWALGNELQTQLPKLLELKTLLWIAMDYRAVVSHYCCQKPGAHRELESFLIAQDWTSIHWCGEYGKLELISIFEKHSIWRRERSPSLFNNYLPMKRNQLSCAMSSETDHTISKKKFMKKRRQTSGAAIFK